MKKFKRLLLVLGGLVLVLLLGVVRLFVSGFAGSAPLPDGANLRGGARLVKDSYVAAFVVPAGPADRASVPLRDGVGSLLRGRVGV